MLICEISFWKPFQWGRDEREKKDWQGKRERKKKDSDTVGRKRERGRQWETWRGFTHSNLQQCFRQSGSLLSLYFYKASRNTSSAIHFISIPTPAIHLHSVSFTSPFHFSACHYISWMITYWQFLHWHSMGQDTTPPASKPGRKWWAFFQSWLSFSFFIPPPWVPVLLSGFHQPPPPSWSSPDLCHLTLMSPCRAQWLPRDTRAGSYISPFHSNKWTRRSIAHLVGCHEIYAIIPNSGAPQRHSAFLYRYYWHIIPEQERNSADPGKFHQVNHFFRSS